MNGRIQMIWLIGNKGMLGSEVSRQLEEAKLPFVGTDKEIDITNPDALENFANNILILLLQFIINMIYFNKLIDFTSIVKRTKKVVNNYFVGTKTSFRRTFKVRIEQDMKSIRNNLVDFFDM